MDSSLVVYPDDQTCWWIADALSMIRSEVRTLKESCVVQVEVDSEQESGFVSEEQEGHSTLRIHCGGVLRSRDLSLESELRLEVAQ